jgi:hypothetical protein
LAAVRLVAANQRAFQDTIEQKVAERRERDDRSDSVSEAKSGREDAAGVVLGGSLGGKESSEAVSKNDVAPAVGNRGGTVNITV